MTKISHPTSGYNQLWRCNAYDSLASLTAIFENPRVHTGKGYRNAGNAVRGCVECGIVKKRSDFSNSQWRKGQDESKCTSCVHNQRQSNDNQASGNEISWESIVDSICVMLRDVTILPQLFGANRIVFYTESSFILSVLVCS